MPAHPEYTNLHGDQTTKLNGNTSSTKLVSNRVMLKWDALDTLDQDEGTIWRPHDNNLELLVHIKDNALVIITPNETERDSVTAIS